MTDISEEAVERVGREALEHMFDRKGLRHALEPIRNEDPEIWQEIVEETGRAALSAMPTQEVSVQDAAKVLLNNSLNPIFDILKPKLMGEFSQKYPFYGEDGDELTASVNVSWAVTKEIIHAALRALSEEEQ